MDVTPRLPPSVAQAPRHGLRWLRLSGLAALCAVMAVAIVGACAQSDSASEKKTAEAISSEEVITHKEVVSGFGNYLAGRFAYASHDIGSAAEYMRKALDDDPGDRSLLQRTVTLLVADGRIDDAVALAPRLIKAEPSARIAHLLLALDNIGRGRREAAKTNLTSIPRDGVYVLLVPAIEAWVAFANGDSKGAFDLLAPLSQRHAYSGFYSFQAGLIADAAGDAKTAEAHYKKAIEATPGGSLRTVEAYGALLERASRLDEARKIYDAYLAENEESVWLETVQERLAHGEKPGPALSDPLDGIAEALFDAASAVPQESGNDAGLLYARLALDIRPDFDVARILIGETFEALRRFDDAYAIYRAVSPESAFSWTARLRAAGSLAEIGRVDEAIADLRVAMAERPDRSDGAVTLGDVLRQAERYGDAAEAYDLAFARIKTIEPHHWSLFYVRGICFERIKNWPRAEADFLKALELEPEQPLVLNYLGYSWVEQGTNLKKALDMIERAVELRPNDPYIVDSLGWALYQTGDYSGAIYNLEKSVELLSNDPVINDHLGDAYWQAGRKTEARFQWERSLNLNPQDDMAAKIRLKLNRGLAAEAETDTTRQTKTE
ncbi:MAG: tetratricopeptide repeat protein [Alphaproteobacteria bacterium]|nr:tetratricopeptide repeat protein [Alphaproteobacteria bacterium]